MKKEMSYKEWASKGYYVLKGEKAHFVKNRPLFYFSQVSKYLQSSEQELHDDYPFRGCSLSL